MAGPNLNTEEPVVVANSVVELECRNGPCELEEVVVHENPEKVETHADGVNVVGNQINLFAAKKTIAQGMMDLALLTANANQLRYLMELNYKTKNYKMLYGMIITSLVLQVGVGCSLIFRGRNEIRGGQRDILSERVNNAVTFSIFLVTVLNVFIASFTSISADNK